MQFFAIILQFFAIILQLSIIINSNQVPKMKQSENLIFTQERVEVTQRIKDGKTLFYACRKKALEFASTIRSYTYEAFNEKGVPIGFCVPK